MPRTPLSRTRILEAAVRMADQEGLDAVTLRRLAAELDVHVTSLYNHVPTKDAVLEGIVDLLIAEARLPVGRCTWQRWVGGMGAGLRTITRRHPGAFAAFGRRPARGSKALAAAEAGLAAFSAGGMSLAEAFDATRTTQLAFLGLAVEDLTRRGLSAAPAPVEEPPPAGAFPLLEAAARFADRAAPWNRLSATLIAGFDAQLRAQPRPSRQRGARRS